MTPILSRYFWFSFLKFFTYLNAATISVTVRCGKVVVFLYSSSRKQQSKQTKLLNLRAILDKGKAKIIPTQEKQELYFLDEGGTRYNS